MGNNSNGFESLIGAGVLLAMIMSIICLTHVPGQINDDRPLFGGIEHTR